MELVYLWVEDYKNIQKQGFNFSSKFICDYDGETLTIKDNVDEKGKKQYIENFFGDNINVTAIVGKNGSGKSSVLEFIVLSIQSTLQEDKSLFIFYDKAVDKLIIRHNFLKKIQILNSEILFDTIQAENEKYETFFKDIQSMVPLFNYSLTYNPKIANDDNELCPKFPNKRLGEISFIEEKKDNLKTILRNHVVIKNQNKSYIFDDFFKVDTVKVYFTNYFHHLIMKDRETNRGEALVKLNNKAVDLFFEDKSIEALKSFVGLFNGLYSESPNRKDEDEYYLDMKNSIKNLDLPDSLFLKNKQTFPIKLSPVRLLIDSIRRRYNFPDYESNSSIDESGVEYVYNPSDFDMNKDVYQEYLFFEWDIQQLEEFEIQKIVDFFYYPAFFIEIVDKESKSLMDLSFGELQLLIILNKILGLCINNKDTDNLFLLLDEIDIGFHPDWQKKTIQYIIDFLSLIPDKNFHLIITTHSPFLLSDIPKENIIFLNDEPSIKQTFGANIHTLLSDSFFMEDGLMGEFAKGKIDKVFKLLNNTTLSVEEQAYCEDIISIIGEPIIKNQLQKMLNHKRLSKVDKIDEMQKQIELLQEEVKKLKSNE